MYEKSFSNKKRELDPVSLFYSRVNGWRMFDAKSLTSTVKFFLKEENEKLALFINTKPSISYNHFVEAGCGYGRYMFWAAKYGLAYDGIELVSWLVDIGRFRAYSLKDRFPDLPISILQGSVEDIDKILSLQPLIKSCKRKSLILFPFNCFGNLLEPLKVLKSLKLAQVDVAVSTFKLDDQTTNARIEYYGRCGYKNLYTSRVEQGLLTQSAEGLYSYAYSEEYLIDLFKTYSFNYAGKADVGNIGLMYFFKFGHKQLEPQKIAGSFVEFSNSTYPSAYFLPQVRILISGFEAVDLYRKAPDDSQLLTFKESQATVIGISKNIFFLETEDSS